MIARNLGSREIDPGKMGLKQQAKSFAVARVRPEDEILFLHRQDPFICGITVSTDRTFHIRLVSANTIRDRFQIPQPECPSRPFSSQIPLNNQVFSLVTLRLVY
jgi:hypothetical protein